MNFPSIIFPLLVLLVCRIRVKSKGIRAPSILEPSGSVDSSLFVKGVQWFDDPKFFFRRV